MDKRMANYKVRVSYKSEKCLDMPTTLIRKIINSYVRPAMRQCARGSLPANMKLWTTSFQ